MFSIDKSDWSRTADKFEKRLKQKGITDEHVRQLGDVLDNNFETILNLEDWNKDYSVDMMVVVVVLVLAVVTMIVMWTFLSAVQKNGVPN